VSLDRKRRVEGSIRVEASDAATWFACEREEGAGNQDFAVRLNQQGRNRPFHPWIKVVNELVQRLALGCPKQEYRKQGKKKP